MNIIYKSKEAIQERVQEHYTHAEGSADGELFGVFLIGSQNYVKDLFLSDSDIDTWAIYLPNLKDLVLERDISLPALIVDNEEHIDRVDARKFMRLLSKPGLTSYQTLFTEFFVVNDKYVEYYDNLVKMREEVVRVNEKRFVMSLMGMSDRDYRGLEREYGQQEADIANLGYSRKKLSNIVRLNSTINSYIKGKPFNECLRSMDQDLIMAIRKTSLIDLNRAREVASSADRETHKLAHDFENEKDSNHLEVLANLEDIFVDLISHDNRLNKWKIQSWKIWTKVSIRYLRTSSSNPW